MRRPNKKKVEVVEVVEEAPTEETPQPEPPSPPSPPRKPPEVKPLHRLLNQSSQMPSVTLAEMQKPRPNRASNKLQLPPAS